MDRRLACAPSALGAILALAAAASIARAQPTCCSPVRIVATSGAGTLAAGNFSNLPFTSGIVLSIDVGAADATCRHAATVPASGFSVPAYCLPALGMTADFIARGCAGGTGEGAGTVWDVHAPCSDADVSVRADTRDDVCDPHALPCRPFSGIADNTRGKIDAVRGNTTCDAPGMQTQLDIPVHAIVWAAGDGSCPDTDGVYDAGTDILVNHFDTLLSLTTASATATFADTNSDGCFHEGNGSNGPITVSGSPASGPCCVPGQAMTLAAAEVVLSGDAPMYDYLLRLKVPMTVTACQPVGSDSCMLPPEDGCSPISCPLVRVVDLPRLYDPNWRIKDWWGPVKRWGPVVAGVGGNILYVPAKVGFAGVGVVATGLTYVASLGSTEAAGAVWSATTGGDYLITPRMVEERRPAAFVGRSGR